MMLICDRCSGAFHLDAVSQRDRALKVVRALPALCPPCLAAEHLAVPLVTEQEIFFAARQCLYRTMRAPL